MASLATFDAFHERLTSSWAQTDIVFENDPYNAADDPAPFVYVEIFGDTYDQRTVGAPGANLWQEEGVTYLHVMTPDGTGSRDAREIAGNLLALFRERDVAGLDMPEMSIGVGDPGRDFPNYWALTASIHWSRRDYTV